MGDALMPEIWDKNYRREDLLRCVGRLEQVAGVRLVTLGDGPERGVRVLEFRTGTGFAFDVVVDRAFDVGRAEAAAKFIIEKAAAHPGELSLIAIGPLTNIALALQTDPRLADRILDLATMGGMLDTSRSDWPPMLETNVQHYMC
jgi:hypothetical protein